MSWKKALIGAVVIFFVVEGAVSLWRALKRQPKGDPTYSLTLRSLAKMCALGDRFDRRHIPTVHPTGASHVASVPADMRPPLRVVFFRSSYFPESAYLHTPPYIGWTPASIHDVQLVGCVAHLYVPTGGTCSYTQGIGVQARVDTNIRLFVATTGKLWKSIELKGGQPPRCPLVLRMYSGQRKAFVAGLSASRSEIGDALGKLLGPAPKK